MKKLNQLNIQKIKLTVNKDNNIYYTENEVLEDIIGWGNSKEEAINDFINFLIAYAHDYYDNVKEYSKTKRGKNDLPYILKIINSSSIEDIKQMLVY